MILFERFRFRLKIQRIQQWIQIDNVIDRLMGDFIHQIDSAEAIGMIG